MALQVPVPISSKSGVRAEGQASRALGSQCEGPLRLHQVIPHPSSPLSQRAAKAGPCILASQPEVRGHAVKEANLAFLSLVPGVYR